MSEKPRASIIIPSRGMEESLRRLLKVLIAELSGQNVEVILVDDGSKKPLSGLAEEYGGKLNLQVIRQEPRGPAVARNLGVKQASSEIIVFLDSDVLPLPGWFLALISPLEKDSGLAGVEGKTIISNPEDLTPFSHFVYNFEGGRYLTCNIAYRKEWFEKVGGFDERFKHPWREDSDLAFSILEQGGRIVFEPNAVVDHPVRSVNLWRLFWFYPIRRGYEWLIYRKHPGFSHKLELEFLSLSELVFIFSFLLAGIFLILGWYIFSVFFLLIHQAIYHHLLVGRLRFGKGAPYSRAVPWKIFAKAYPFFYPATFLSFASLIWGWVKFLLVKPAIKFPKEEK